MSDTPTAAPKGPAPKFDKSLEEAKRRGTVKPEAAEALKNANVNVSTKAEPAAPKLGVSQEESEALEVQLPDPVADKKATEIQVVQPAEIDKSGQIIFTQKHLELIKNQFAKDATTEEFQLFLMMSYRTRLDPLMKQLYFIKYGGKVNYVTSIDGYRIIAHRTGDFAGVDLPIYEYDDKGKVTYCAITVYKFVQGQKVGFSAKVKFSEYSTGINQWAPNAKPETMIAKVAEAHALRKAFPNDLSGIYTQDEMEQAEQSNRDQKPKQQAAKPAAPAKPPISPAQKTMIKELLERKDVSLENLKPYMEQVYKKKTIGELNVVQAKHLIEKLEAKPDALPVEDVTPEEDFEAFIDSQESDDIVEDVSNALG